MGGFSLGLGSVSAAAHQTGLADLPHPALQNCSPELGARGLWKDAEGSRSEMAEAGG
jgi:hypothetical protein